MRSFKSGRRALHKRLPFSTVKIAHSSCPIFDKSIYSPTDEHMVLVEFEGSGQCNQGGISGAFKEISDEK